MKNGPAELDGPLVSIGLAVFNGADYVAEAIESIRQQTLQNWELIITDNASTDSTQKICEEFVRLDPRVRYHRNSANLGAVRNENLAFSMSRGKYFRWLGHDDRCAPELLAESVAALDRDLSAVLCQPWVLEINEDGTPLARGPLCDASSPERTERLRHVMRMDHKCYEFYALMRSDVLRAVREQQVYVDSDRTLLAELALVGRFHVLEKELFFRRIHPKKSTILFPSWRDRMVWYDPTYRTKITFPFWMQFGDYLVRIGRVRMPFTEKLRCYGLMFGWLADGHGRSMIKDVLLAIQKVFVRLFSKLIPAKAGEPNQVA